MATSTRFNLPNNAPPQRHDVRADVYKILSSGITPPAPVKVVVTTTIDEDYSAWSAAA